MRLTVEERVLGPLLRGENPSWPSVSVESVDSEYWSLNNAFVYVFIMRLTMEERVLGPLLRGENPS